MNVFMTEDEADELYVAANTQLQRMSFDDPRRRNLSAALRKFSKATNIMFKEEENDTEDEQSAL